MATKYKVKAGDTLGEISRQLGVGMDKISGFKSGNPDLIYPGEELSIGGNDYVGEVKSQLGSEDSSATEPKTEKKEDPYDSTKIRNDISTYKSGMDSAFNKLKTIQKETFDKEYESRGLGNKKTTISSLDESINAKRADRDAAIAKVRGRSDISDATMTGKAKKIADAINAEINNLIQQRNSVAGEYNTELGEINAAVARSASEPESEYNYYKDLLTRTDSELSNYQKEMKEALKEERRQEEWEKELAQALEIAQIKKTDGPGSTKMKIWRNQFTGKPEFWYDDYGNTYPYEEGDTEETAGVDEADAEVASDNESEGGWLKGIRNWFAGLGK